MKRPKQTSFAGKVTRSDWLTVVLSICAAAPLASNAQPTNGVENVAAPLASNAQPTNGVENVAAPLAPNAQPTKGAENVAVPLASNAQPTNGAENLDPALVNRLLQRIDQLEQKAKRVDELESEIKSLQSSVPAVTPAPPLPVIHDKWPQVDFNLFGDVDFHASSDKSDKNSFILGNFDPVIVAKLSEKAQVLGDFVIASDIPSGNGFTFEFERLLLEYDFNDYFHVEAGRFHTGIGYYNDTFHNCTYFQTTVERPAIYLFEDHGGILPIHNNGVEISGEIPSGSLGLYYAIQVANGRSYDTTKPIFEIQDNNDYKAVNVALWARPEWAPNWQFGGSAYHDTLTPFGVPKTDQLIFSAYVAYRSTVFEWLNEGIIMRDAPEGQKAYLTSAAYTQISRKFGKFRPYARMQWRNSPADDPVLANIGENFTVWGPVAGIRYDFAPMMALKLEYDHTEQHGVAPLNEVFVQWTFRF